MAVEAAATAVGFELAPVTKEITFAKMYGYSARFGGPFLTSVHTDRSCARAAGLPDAVCQGTMLLNYVSEMLFRVYREHWLNSAKLSIAFLRPVFEGDVIRARGVVKESQVTDSVTRIKLDVWAENKGYETVLVGEARVTIEHSETGLRK